MPWTSSQEGTLPSLKNKPKELREIFARVANAALADNKKEEDAIYAGLAAVANEEKKKKRELTKKLVQSILHDESTEDTPITEPLKPLPSHLSAILGEGSTPVEKALKEPLMPSEGPRIRQAFLGKNALVPDPERSLVQASWDKVGRLILQFSDGKQIITDRVPVEEKIEQTIGVSVNPMFDFIRFNTEANLDQTLPGWLSWNSFEDCLDITQADGTTLQTGLENYIQVINNTGSTLPNGCVVSFSGVDLNEIPECSALMATPDFAPLYIIGVLTNALSDGQRGRATIVGKVRNLNTTGSSVGETWNQGDLLWAHPTIAGAFTRNKPSAPNPSISVAAVLKVSSTEGIILVRPTIFPRLFYAKYLSNQSQIPVATNTPYAVSFNTTEIQSGIEISEGTKIKVKQAGLYSFDFRLQVTSTNSSAKNIYIWARKNGVDVPTSATKITLVGNSVEISPSWSFVYTMQQNDYFQLMYATDDTSIIINAPAPTAFCPSTPSAILKVNQVDL